MYENIWHFCNGGCVEIANCRQCVFMKGKNCSFESMRTAENSTFLHRNTDLMYFKENANAKVSNIFDNVEHEALETKRHSHSLSLLFPSIIFFFGLFFRLSLRSATVLRSIYGAAVCIFFSSFFFHVQLNRIFLYYDRLFYDCAHFVLYHSSFATLSFITVRFSVFFFFTLSTHTHQHYISLVIVYHMSHCIFELCRWNVVQRMNTSIMSCGDNLFYQPVNNFCSDLVFVIFLYKISSRHLFPCNSWLFVSVFAHNFHISVSQPLVVWILFHFFFVLFSPSLSLCHCSTAPLFIIHLFNTKRSTPVKQMKTWRLPLSLTTRDFE